MVPGITRTHDSPNGRANLGCSTTYCGQASVQKAFIWKRVCPFIAGGVIGLPFGILLLRSASPQGLRFAVGTLLVAYALIHLLGVAQFKIGDWGGNRAGGLVGIGGGLLGGFAGLSGPLPLIWLQLRSGESDQQRATYQPFNLIILALASIGMAVSGQINTEVITIVGWCLPVTLVGAWIGTRI